MKGELAVPGFCAKQECEGGYASPKEAPYSKPTPYRDRPASALRALVAIPMDRRHSVQKGTASITVTPEVVEAAEADQKTSELSD